MLQKRRISGWFWNVQMSQSFTRNNCPVNNTPGSVTYTVPVRTYRARTQTAANNLAQSDINANGQNNANTLGTCTPYPGNVQLSQTLTRNNCPAYHSAGSATYIVYADTYFAPTQTEANALAQTDIDTNAQTWVNNNAACTPWTRYEVRPFTTVGTGNWAVPSLVTVVDVFLVGGGGSGGSRGLNVNSSTISGGGGGGGYTQTFTNISVTPSQNVQIIRGSGGAAASSGCNTSNCNGVSGSAGGFSQFLNTSYRADGGNFGTGGKGTAPIAAGQGGRGGSSGGAAGSHGWGNSGEYNGQNYMGEESINSAWGQGTTTRDFGEVTGLINAGGGGGGYYNNVGANGPRGGFSDYTQGVGGNNSTGTTTSTGGGGWGGGGAGASATNPANSGAGGIGSCLVRYYAP